MTGEIPWFKQRMTIREHDAPCSPSSEIKITQYANSLTGVQERFNESAGNITGLPQYSGPDSRGRWTVSWRERRQAGYRSKFKFGWFGSPKKK